MRTQLIDTCVNTLAVYRKFCASPTSSGQLILPEALKLLPVYVLALIKHAVLRAGNDVHPDERAHFLLLVGSVNPATLISLIYPRMYALHQLPKDCGLKDADGNSRLPPILRLSAESLDTQGVYLLEDGQNLLAWIGRNVSASFVEEVFGSAEADQQTHIPPNELSSRIHAILKAVRKSKHIHSAVQLLKQDDAHALSFYNYLAEDKGHDAMSYVDFLCYVHKQIQTKLS